MFSRLACRIFFALLITFVYFCGRTFYAYKSSSASNKSLTTAVKLRELVDEAAFMERLQQVIRDEMKDLQTKERIKSARVIARLTDEYQVKLAEKQEATTDKTSPAFSFRFHMNFTKLFGFL